MATSVQIVFDCADPNRLATVWAAALHYKMDDPPTGFASWPEFLKAQGVPKSEWNSASAIVDPDGIGPRIYFQQFDTPKPVKNRVHLDVNAAGGRAVTADERLRHVDAEAERLVALGATKQRAWDEDGGHWVVLLDPEGNEFCV